MTDRSGKFPFGGRRKRKTLSYLSDLYCYTLYCYTCRRVGPGVDNEKLTLSKGTVGRRGDGVVEDESFGTIIVLILKK